MSSTTLSLLEKQTVARGRVLGALFLFLWGVFYLAEPLAVTFSIHESANFHQSDLTAKDRAEHNIDKNEEGSRARQLALVALAGFGVIVLVRPSARKIEIRGVLAWTIIFFLGWSALSILWSDMPSMTVRKLGVLTCLCVGALGCARLFSLREILLFALFSTGLLMVLGLVCEILLGSLRPWVDGYRFSGITWPAYTGWNISLFLVGLLVVRERKEFSGLLLALVAVSVIILLLTRTRANLAALLLALVVYAFLTWPIKRQAAAIVLVGMLGSLGCLIIELLGGDLVKLVILATSLGRTESLEGVSGRGELWGDLLPYLQDRLLLGYGYDSFWTPRHLYVIGESNWGAPDAHNGYLNLALGVGIVGALTYVLVLFLALTRAWACYRQSSNRYYLFAVCAILILVVNVMFVSSQLAPALYSFITMIVLARLGFIEDLSNSEVDDKRAGHNELL